MKMKRLKLKQLLLLVGIVLTCSLSVFGQGRSVSGVVNDTKGEPIPGVSVIVKGTTNGTITDINGNYNISVSTSDAVITFSFIGMKTQEIIVGSQSTIDVVLQDEMVGVDEVVVVGYGTQKKVNLTGAVSTVKMDEAVNQPVTNSSQLMYGRFTGVQLTQGNGLPGNDGASIQIRGVGTFGGETNPLVVIDGMQFSSMTEFNNLAPSDIESISVLKDASASAIYGARGANGVIIVTTKGGKEGDVKVEYNNYFGLQEATIMPEYLNAVDYAELINEKFANEGEVARYTPEQLELIKNGNAPDQFAQTNWADHVLEKAPIQNHYLSLSGGNKKTKFRLSLGYLDQDAILVGKYKSQRYNFRLNLNSKVKDWLTINNNFNGYWKAFNGPKGGADAVNEIMYQFSRNAPTIPVYLSNGEYGHVDGAFYNQNASLMTKNAVRELNLGNYEQDQYTINDRLAVNITPLSGLSIESSGTINMRFTNTSNFTPRWEMRDWNGDLVNYNEFNSLRNEAAFYYKLMNENVAKYTRQFGEHNITGMMGTSVIYETSDGFNASLSNFPSDDLEELGAGGVLDPSVGGSKWEESWFSVFGRINYSFKDRYLLEANLRRDGSSRFGPDNKYGVFPSFSGGWRISEEPFMDNLSDIFANLKLRGSWGVSGNDRAVKRYAYSQAYNSGLDYVLGVEEAPVGGVALTSLANPAIAWEETTQFDIGLDAGFLNNRLQLVADYFERESKDVLYQNFPIPSTLGVSSLPAQNVGDIINKGWELGINYFQKVGDFEFSIGGNVTNMFLNEVTSLGAGGEETITNSSIVRVGEVFNAYYGLEAISIFQTPEEVADAPVQFGGTTTSPGDIRYKDQLTVDTDGDGIPDAGDGVINDDDRVVIGNPHPKWIYSFNASASYKGFDMSFNFQGLADVDRIMMGNGQTPMTDDRRNVLSYWKDRWTEDNPSASLPRLGRNFQNDRVSSFYVEDGSYLRLKNLEFGYTLPKSILSQAGIDKFRVFVSGQNLLTFTKMDNFDPERKSTNVNARNVPLTKVYTVGVNLSF